MEDEYLGDGVYARWDGYHVWLDLRGQAGRAGTWEIGMEPPVLRRFEAFVRRVRIAESQPVQPPKED